ncbi:MAG TPA: SUMF1/EgtB/PvdO family nonheme iron enzyme [Terriglobia bacterium]|nr:SUMF1/EgtB/PvdO family nonheme iron enzyme [Terriglobia bacterium]
MTKTRLLISLLLFHSALGFAQDPMGYRVSGRIYPAENQTPGTPIPDIGVVPRPARGNVARLTGAAGGGGSIDVSAFIGPDGSFEFRNVPAGSYQVMVNPAPSLLPVNVTVRDRDVNVQIGRPWVHVAGTVTVEGGGPIPPFLLDFQSLTASNEPDPGGQRMLAQAGQAFSIDLPAGLYRVNVNDLPAEFLIRSITQGTARLDGQPLRLNVGEFPEIAITLEPGTPSPWVRVSGRVTGAAAAGVRTVLLRGPALISPLSASVSSEGSFEFPRTPAGRYEARLIPALIAFPQMLVVGNVDLTGVTLKTPVAMELAGEFVRIEPGVFLMGCPPATPTTQRCDASELPVHRVGITKRFEIGKFEVTQAQWEAVMGNNPSSSRGPSKPVDSVSWEDAQEFILRLNALDPDYRYRLPTEAEWEYAARAGSAAADVEAPESDAYGWFNTNAGGESHPVGEKRPNAWGLYDMRGNVQEWTEDWLDEAYYASSVELDPTGPASGQQHVLRGGAYTFHPDASRRTSRRAASAVTGFRLCREPIRK